MFTTVALTTSQIVVQVCLFLVAAIAIFGGSLQFYLGQPDTSPRLDNVHRFMAGVYLSTGIICLWAALTIRQQGFWSTCLRSECCLQVSGGLSPSRRLAYQSRLPCGSAISSRNCSFRSSWQALTMQAHKSIAPSKTAWPHPLFERDYSKVQSP